MNFIEEFKFGQRGGNKGLPLGPGLEKLSKAINGIQKKMMIGVASPPKTGKSTFVDYAFIIQPYLANLEQGLGIDLRFIYFSFEMDRITKEFDFAAYFLFHDFGVEKFILPAGVTWSQGRTEVPLSSDLLRGRVLDDNNETIKIDQELLSKLTHVYNSRIIPLFGEYDTTGKKLSPGKIIFEEKIENPTGLYNKMLRFAGARGKFKHSEFTDAEGKVYQHREAYTPDNPDEFVIVIYDTIRKIAPERGFNTKQTVDKMLEYSTILKKLCGYTFIPIIHLNRDLGNANNMTYMKDRVYPTPEMVKDTGNISEECNHFITLFNPHDDRFNLTTHFGEKLRDAQNNKIHPFLRTVHLVESRQVVYPQHFRVQMKGNIKNFEQI